MTKNTYQFTSESVSAGHPDKVADQISDAILDAYLAQDSNAKVACECLITTGLLLIAGEVTANPKVDHTHIAKQVLERIGYNDNALGFNHHTAEIRDVIHTQSPEILQSVFDGSAGDQGIKIKQPEFLINPSGSFLIGGPHGDTDEEWIAAARNQRLKGDMAYRSTQIPIALNSGVFFAEKGNGLSVRCFVAP